MIHWDQLNCTTLSSRKIDFIVNFFIENRGTSQTFNNFKAKKNFRILQKPTVYCQIVQRILSNRKMWIFTSFYIFSQRFSSQGNARIKEKTPSLFFGSRVLVFEENSVFKVLLSP